MVGLVGEMFAIIPIFAELPHPSTGEKPFVEKVSTTQPPTANKLDTAWIHAAYLEGDFDPAIEAIEDARKYGGPFSRQDSIFMFKHLGVMYAAKYETREKGKHFMLALLEVEPTAKILDMYASDMIYMIFKNVKDEFEARNPQLFAGYHPLPVSKHDSVRPAKPRGSAWLGWTAGTAALLGGAVLAVHFWNERGPEGEKLYTSHD